MKAIKNLLFVAASSGLFTLTAPLYGQSTAFTYQGRLLSSGTSPTGNYDLLFSLYTNSSGGFTITGPVTNLAVGVTNGLFTTSLDFGANTFNGTLYWLDIQVRTNGSGSWTALAPRQPVTPSPYAIYAANATLAGTITGALPVSSLPSTVLTNGGGINARNLTNGLSVVPNQLLPLSHVAESALPSSSFPEAFSIAVSGNYAYLANFQSGLSVLDVTDPGNPAVKSSIAESSMGNGFAAYLVVSGSIAYLANENDGLRIINISNPSAPVLTGNVPESSMGNANAFGVAVSGNYAYVANGSAGFVVVDVSTPAAPVVKTNVSESFLGNGGASRVTVSGNYAYLANSSGLSVIDISNPLVPLVKTNYPQSLLGNSGNADGITVSGNYAYVGIDNGGLDILDVSNPLAPLLKTNIPESAFGGIGVTTSIAISGNLAYVANRSVGFSVINIANPAVPVIVTNITESSLGNGAVRDIAVSGGFVYVANDTDGVRVFSAFNTVTAGAYIGDGSQLTRLNSASLTGTLPVSVLPSSVVTNTETGVTLSGTFSGTGSLLGGLSATSLSSGTVADARLSSNVALRSGPNAFSGTQTVASGFLLGIGTNTPQADLHVMGVTAFNQAIIESAATGGTWLSVQNDYVGGRKWSFVSTGASNAETAGKLLFYDGSGGGVRMTFDTAGNVGIGNTSPAYKLDVNGNIHGNNVTVPSDVRFKTNIATLTHPLEKIEAMRGVQYDWRRDEFPEKHFDDQRQIGFIAQELKGILPEAVLQDEHGYYSVSYDKVVPVLVEALKEERRQKDAEIKFLKERLDALEKSVGKKD